MLFNCWVVSNSLWPRGLQQGRLLYPLLSPRACSYSCPLSWWCYLTISSSAVLFSFCLQSFPASGSFPMSWLLISGSQSIGASVSVPPVNIQCLFPLGLTDLISLQSKGLLRVYISLHKYYLLLEWKRAWHQFHSYFLFYRWNAQKACSNSQVDKKKNGKNLFACIILL